MPPTTSTQNSTKKMKYREVEDFDVTSLPADLPPGKWRFRIESAIPRATKSGDPMISFKFVAIEAEDQHESLVGKSVDELVIFYSNSDTQHSRASRMNKIRLRQICQAVGLELDAIPTHISATGEELDEFAAQLKGMEFQGWTTVSKNADTGEERTNVLYEEPGGGMSLADNDEDEKKPAAKKSKRR